MLRFLLWRLLGLLALVAGFALAVWLLRGGPGRLLRGERTSGELQALPGALLSSLAGWAHASSSWAPLRPALALGAALLVVVALVRACARARRRYVRLQVHAYRTDHASPEELVSMLGVLHKLLLRRWWRRLLLGQPSLALEVHSEGRPSRNAAWLAVSCPQEQARMVEAALQSAYPNSRLQPTAPAVGCPPVVLRLKKHADFIKRLRTPERYADERQPIVNRLLTAMGACGVPAFLQIAMTPTPTLFEGFAKRRYRHLEARLSRERREHLFVRDRSLVEDVELRGGLEVQHKPLFFADLRVVAPTRAACERIASELRAESAENRLVERGTTIRHRLLGLYNRRVARGEGNPLPSFHKGVFASTELALMWQLPTVDYLTVPFRRTGLPLAPASPTILRPNDGGGTLRDALGTVSIHPELRKQNTAVPGTVEQGKSSYLVASIAEDLRRECCAVIVLDPKGDAADAAVSLVAPERTCTLLELSHPTCGFNPLAVHAPADVIADYVVAALKNLFTDADIRASSDRYLRNAIIAVLAYDRTSTLWDAARLLSVGEEGYAYRSSVGARVRALPEFKEISEFFTAELSAQLADARSTTTAKLDAPVNKLARLLNSASIKRVLLNDSLMVDFDRVIAHGEVLVVKGALGAMGAGNTSVLMQLLVGMLDAALARQQDLVPAEQRVAVALKVDEAPLVLNRGFAETMALKRSAGLETVACWQADAQWTDREVRDQLDALFAHRVYFATASTTDARAAAALTMAEFSDTIRPGIERLSSLGHPDVRLHLPKHHAIASWVTPEGRQPPFVAETIPLAVDRERLALHAARQIERGARHLSDLRQPHWDRARRDARELRPHDSRASDGPHPGSARALPRRDQSSAKPLASAPTASYRELVEMDGAHSVRPVMRAAPTQRLELDRLDLAMLALIAEMGHVLTSQLHRRFNAGRAASTTQRRLKRVSDAGLVERLQFHRSDGGGIPMCHVIAAPGVSALEAHGVLGPALSHAPAHARASQRAPVPGADADWTSLRQTRREVHIAGWTLALAQALEGANPKLRGPRDAALSPPTHSTSGGRVALSPSDLRLPGGRTPHDFLQGHTDGRSVEVERFETIRPDAIVELTARDDDQTPAVDIMIEYDDRLAAGRGTAKLQRYEHFLTGWSAHTRRYGSRAQALALVVFVCRDRARARDCARAADLVLRACRAYPGEYPTDWEYPARAQILFVAERDVHEGLLRAYGVPRLPPHVRIAVAHGDPRAGEASVEPRALLDEQGALDDPAV
ncbi:MAG: replication-relaxation family protein [Solirubrobacteraceae bacterium]